MDYEKIYNNIIKKYKTINLSKTKTNQYLECHHIIPKSMGGLNTKDNLVNLPAREHYICHWLLYKIYKNSEMAFAWHSMSAGNKLQEQRYTSHTFKYAREARSNSMKGHKHNEETKIKIGLIHKGKIVSKVTRKKQSAAQSGKIISDEQKLKLSIAGKGKKRSLASRQNISKGLIGNKYALGKVHEKLTCPHCNKIGGKGGMKRYHFNNCKSIGVL